METTTTRNDIGETPERAADLDAREIAAIRRLLQDPGLTSAMRHAAEQGALWHGITDRPVWAVDDEPAVEAAPLPADDRTDEQVWLARMNTLVGHPARAHTLNCWATGPRTGCAC